MIPHYRAPGSEIAISIEHPGVAELRQQLERLAREEGRPLSYLVRRVLRVETVRAQTQRADRVTDEATVNRARWGHHVAVCIEG